MRCGVQARLTRRLLPNVTRIFKRWGLLDALRKAAVEPRNIYFRRWADGRKIGKTALVPDFEQRFDSPYLVAHRAHMHTILYTETLRLGGVVRVDSAVASVDFDKPSVTLKSGETVVADAVIGADGIKSATRAQLLAKPDDAPVRTGFCAYRALVPVETLRANPLTAKIVEQPELNVWIGEDRHVRADDLDRAHCADHVLSR